MKKILFGFGVVTTALVPLVAAVSCGESEKPKDATEISMDGISVKIENNLIKSVLVDGSRYSTVESIGLKLNQIIDSYKLSRPDNLIDLVVIENNEELANQFKALQSFANIQNGDTTEPETQTTTKPEVQTTEPETQTTSEPEVQTTEPETQTTSEPEVQTTEPETQTTSEPEVQTTTQPEQLQSVDMEQRIDDLDQTSQFREDWHREAQSIPSTSLEDTAIDLSQRYDDLEKTNQFREDWQSQIQPEDSNSQTTSGPTVATPVDMDFDHSIYEVKSISTRTDWSTLDPIMQGKLKNGGATLPEISATVYETEYINFAFDNDLHFPEAEAKKLIEEFFKGTTWGYGLLTMDTILITDNGLSGASGHGGAVKDILVNSRVYDASAPDNSQNVQQMFDIMRHEYGHHETMSSDFLVGGSYQRSRNLVDFKAPNSDILYASWNNNATELQNMAAEMQRNVDLFSDVDHTPNSELVKNIYTADVFSEMQNGANYVVDANTFQLKYQYSQSETVNRAMNILESTPLESIEDLNGSTIIAIDNITYYFSDENHSQKILDPTTGLYDQTNTNKIIDLWKDYVYGYGANKLIVDYDGVRGYTDQDIDFALVTTDSYLSQETVKLKKSPSHFITSRTSYDVKPTWDTSHVAYKGAYAPSPIGHPHFTEDQKIDSNRPVFYKDTNHSGELDGGDQIVQNVNYDWNM